MKLAFTENSDQLIDVKNALFKNNHLTFGDNLQYSIIGHL